MTRLVDLATECKIKLTYRDDYPKAHQEDEATA